MATSNILDKMLLFLNIIAFSSFFGFVFFFWDTTFYSDLDANFESESEFRQHGLLKRRGRLCTPLSGCLVREENTINQSSGLPLSSCAQAFYEICRGSVRCCRDCKLIALAAQWKHVTKVGSNEGGVVKIPMAKKMPHDELVDVHLKPLTMTSVGLIVLMILYIFTIRVSFFESKMRKLVYYAEDVKMGHREQQSHRRRQIQELPDVAIMRRRRKYRNLDEQDEELQMDEWTDSSDHDNTKYGQYHCKTTSKRRLHSAAFAFMCISIPFIILGSAVHSLATFGYTVALVVGAPQHDSLGTVAVSIIKFLGGKEDVNTLAIKTMSPFRECRIVFTAFVMTLCMSILFLVEVLKSINFSYNKVLEKRAKAVNHLMTSKNMDKTTAKIFVQTVDLMKENQCKSDEKMVNFFYNRCNGGCCAACCHCMFKLFIAFNGLCVLTWVLVAIDIILLYNGTCMIASECH